MIGARVRVDANGQRIDRVLFGEDQSRIVVSAAAESVQEIVARAGQFGIPTAVLGTVGGDSLVIEGCFDIPVGELREAFTQTLSAALDE